MLNSDQLSKYIVNPELLNTFSLREMQLLTDQYPFFQTAHLLEVKNYHTAGSYAFPSKLAFCAAYVTDRRILYELLFPWELKTTDVGTGAYTGKAEKERKQTLQEHIADTLNAQLDITRSLNPDLAELKPNIALDVKKEYGEVFFPETGEEETKAAEMEVTERERIEEEGIGKDELEGEAAEKAGAESEAAEKEVAEREEADKEAAEKDKHAREEAERMMTEMETAERDEGEMRVPEWEEAEKKVAERIEAEGGKAEEETESTIIWLDESDGAPVQPLDEELPTAQPVELPDDLIDLEESKTVEPVSASAENIVTQQPEAAPETGKKHVPGAATTISNHELINRFIETNPSITPPSETDQQVDISADSVREDEGFLTDTLAKIYIKQGYYSKAIFAYEKLLLKFPEKSAYFAAQIESIKKLMNKEEK
jgi:hypothetical protein